MWSKFCEAMTNLHHISPDTYCSFSCSSSSFFSLWLCSSIEYRWWSRSLILSTISVFIWWISISPKNSTNRWPAHVTEITEYLSKILSKQTLFFEFLLELFLKAVYFFTGNYFRSCHFYFMLAIIYLFLII